MTAGRIHIGCAIASRINVAFYQNAIPVVSEIVLENGLECDIDEITLHISSEPGFLRSTTLQIDRIAAEGLHHLSTPDLHLDAGFLMKLTEAVRGEVLLTVEAKGAKLAAQRFDVELLPPSHWGGSSAAPELLVAFVRPNDPAVEVILHDAAGRLAAAGRLSAIDGYVSGGKARAWEIAEAIWAAIASRGIAYVLPPASFERVGQKVRSPSDILERRVGTCLDTTLFYAACLEQAGLNPLLVLTQGHAFPGFWLRPENLASATVDEAEPLRKRRDLEEIVFVETTLLTSVPPTPFAAAVQRGADHLDEGAPAALEVAIDVRRARDQQIKPLNLDTDSLPPRSTDDRPAPVIELGEPRSFDDDVRPGEARQKEGPEDRLERWKRKLLDLTLRNKLLNFNDVRKAVPLECPDPAKLEDLLAAGQHFRLMPRTDILGEDDARSAQLLAQRNQDDAKRRFLDDSLTKGVIYTTLAETDLDGRLTDLYRLTRVSFEEGGANILFLALGFLKWRQLEGTRELRAPILLVPVALQRASVRAGYRLAIHEDEALINPTLLEMLRQDFDLRLPELEGELPTDSSGIDVGRVWRIVRANVRDIKGWEVTSDVVLSTFSFTKYLMWKDLVDRTSLLKQNPVVRHLIETPKHAYGDGTGFPAPERLDLDYPAETIFAPLSADSSQLSAVLAAAAGKDFVLFGPPGTGKSQTIANMIAQCLAKQKTVLFVSQKTAALEVVQRRLRELGLGEYCLEVHSTKAQKSAVLNQLKAAWYGRDAANDRSWAVATQDLQTLRDELNALVDSLHGPRPNGWTAYQAFGLTVAYRDAFADIALGWPSAREDSAEALARCRRICRDLRPAAQAIGEAASHPLRGIGAIDWSPEWRNDMNEAIDKLRYGLAPLEAGCDEFAAAIGLSDVPAEPGTIAALIELGDLVLEPLAPRAVALLGLPRDGLGVELEELRLLKERAARARSGLARHYELACLDQDLQGLRRAWQEASTVNFLLRGSRQTKVRRQLRAWTQEDVEGDIGRDLDLLIELQEIDASVRRLAPRVVVLGRLWQGLNTSTDEVAELIGWCGRVRKLLGNLPPALGGAALRERIVTILEERPEIVEKGSNAHRALENLRSIAAKASAAVNALRALANAEPTAFAAAGPGWIGTCLEIAARWQQNLATAPRWASWQQATTKAHEAGLSSLVAALEAGTLQHDAIESAFDVAYARWWTDRIVTRDPILRGFLLERHEDTIARFRAADERVSMLAREIVRARLGSVPSPTTFGADGQWGALAHELTKKARYMPLRRLFANIPNVVTRLTPCVMMSPLSIAQYWPADAPAFDLVLFDEASQVPVWDAIGAIARGKQVVIVGDPQQLPPTSVGERGVDEIEDGTDIADQESILDQCLAANLPQQKLTWHYRSRHESLITFSNGAYYDGNLVTFPSPVTADRAVRYVHVPGGVYERGSGRVNREEARAVVDDAVRRLRDPAFARERRSLGIVTFNGEQQRLIENLLDRERRNDAALEPFFDPQSSHEPVFVKNLENVQGDERDIILFSVAVAPEDGKSGIGQISSLNKEGGHRRLNVAITRARDEMAVFATLRPEQIDLTRTKARGVRDFKHFLEYADRGARALNQAASPTGREPESPFETAVMQALENKGWVVHPQVGVSTFRIDLGIVHPDAPGRYLAGIECDGASYHRSATARDRDRLREMVLTNLGWRIRRIWSMEWWHDASAAMERLQTILERDLANDRTAEAAAAAMEEAEPELPVADPAAEAALDLPESSLPLADPEMPTDDSRHTDGLPVVELPPDRQDDLRPPATEDLPTALHATRVASITPAALPAHPAEPIAYAIADFAALEGSVDPDRFHEALYRPVLSAMTAHVIGIEGPIYDDVLVRRIARAHGFARAGGRIRDAVLSLVEPRFERSEEEGRGVFWPEGSDLDGIYSFREASPGLREHGDIPIGELAGLARRFLSEGADRGEAVRRMADYFKLARLREPTRLRFEAAISKAMSIR